MMIKAKSQGLPVQEAALESLFLEKYPLMYNIAFQLLFNRDDAEDAVQDAFVKWWNNRAQWKNETHARATCILAVRNVCIDKLRTRKATKGLSPQLEEQIDDDSYTALRKILRADLYKVVLRAMEQMSPARREVIELTLLKEMSLEEAAAHTGRGYDATKALNHKAWAQLRRILMDQYRLSPELLLWIGLYWYLQG